MFEFWNPTVRKSESIHGSRLNSQSATHVQLKAVTKIVPSMVQTKPDKNADNINVNANDKATNQLPVTNVFAAGTSTGLNSWTCIFVQRKSTKNNYENCESTNPSLSRGDLTACTLTNVGCGRRMALVERPNPKYNIVDAILHAYSERQDRNECVNLASQMGYTMVQTLPLQIILLNPKMHNQGQFDPAHYFF